MCLQVYLITFPKNPLHRHHHWNQYSHPCHICHLCSHHLQLHHHRRHHQHHYRHHRRPHPDLDTNPYLLAYACVNAEVFFVIVGDGDIIITIHHIISPLSFSAYENHFHEINCLVDLICICRKNPRYLTIVYSTGKSDNHNAVTKDGSRTDRPSCVPSRDIIISAAALTRSTLDIHPIVPAVRTTPRSSEGARRANIIIGG